jgi:uncharacterized phage-associated protein
MHNRGRRVMPNSPAGSFDPRSICNLILDASGGHDRPITNLALQKLLYFAHGLHLIETKTPLVSGAFEAWKYGPVHPTAYRAFKEAGAAPIRFRAALRDPFTHAEIPLPPCTDTAVHRRVHRIVSLYSRLTPGRLVEISHAKGAPWHFVVEKAKTKTILGLRIPDNVIAERFRYHKVSVGLEPRHGEPCEEEQFL